ncbi:hypothetical protein [Thalassiella azotivora]
MLWFAIWTVLVLGALVVLGLLAYRLVRKGLVLVTQVGEAAELLDRAAAQVERLQRAEQAPEPAVFADPHELRRERDRRRRGARPRRTMRATRAGG